MSTRTAVEEICGVDIRKIWNAAWEKWPDPRENIFRLLKLKPTNMNNNPSQKIRRVLFEKIFPTLPMSEQLFLRQVMSEQMFNEVVEFTDTEVKRMFKEWYKPEHKEFMNTHFLNIPETDLFDMRQYHSGMSHSLRPHFGDTDSPSAKAMIELVQSGAFFNKGYFLNRDFKWEIRGGEYNGAQILVPIEKLKD